jgi:hypothetical protein
MHVTSIVTPTQTLVIAQAVHALTPFAEINAAKATGFEVSRSFSFELFAPTMSFLHWERSFPSELANDCRFGSPVTRRKCV